MKQYQCKRKIKIDVDEKNNKKIYKNIVVVDSEKNEQLFPECLECNFSSKGIAWTGERWKGVSREIKLCSLKEVS